MIEVIFIVCYIIIGTFLLGLTDKTNQEDPELRLIRTIFWPLCVLNNIFQPDNIITTISNCISHIYEAGFKFRK